MRSSLSPLSALALLPLLGCPATDDDGGEPVDGASTVTEDCAPDDGPAWSFDIGVEDDTCTAAHAQPFLRVTVWEHTSTMAGQTWSLSPDMGQGQVLYFADPSSNVWQAATDGTFTVDAWTDGEGGDGSYDLTLEDGTHLVGEFDAAYCPGVPMCG